MKQISFTLTCRELYEKVWTTPMVLLAREFGLSDVALAKICKKNYIPRPPRGYWEKLRAGQKLKKPALPETVDGVRVTITGYLREEGDQLEEFDEADFYSEVKPLIDAESDRKSKIVVPRMVISSDELVRNTLKRLREGSEGRYDRISSAGTGLINVSVSKSNIERSMRIIGALVDALNARKFRITTYSRTYSHSVTQIQVLNQKVTFRLQEKIGRRSYDPKRDQKRYGHRFSAYGSPPAYIFEPNGKLLLQITNAPQGYWIKEKFIDSENYPLETQLNDFVVNVIKAAVALKHEEVEREEKRQQAAALERERQERLRQEQVERERIAQQERMEKERNDRLFHQAESYRKSKEIRAFIEETRTKWLELNGPIAPGTDMEAWLNWAMQQASVIDPLAIGWPWQDKSQ